MNGEEREIPPRAPGITSQDIDFGAIVEDHHSILPQHPDSVEIREGSEPMLHHVSATKGQWVHNQGDWIPQNIEWPTQVPN